MRRIVFLVLSAIVFSLFSCSNKTQEARMSKCEK